MTLGRGLVIGGVLLLAVAVLLSSASAVSTSHLYEFGNWGGQLNNPHSGGNNPLIYWSALETADGTYNWAPLDDAINTARNAGRHIVPRIYTNVNNQGPATPTWFFAKPGAQSYQPSGGPISPVPWDPVYQEEFSQFLAVLGARYNNNPAIKFFQTNAGGGAYGESWLGVNHPEGYSPAVHFAAQEYWIDQWRAAFPSKPLTIMVNELGNNILEDVSAYAVSKGFYLQANQPVIAQSLVNVFDQYDGSTAIVMEIENWGCTDATVPEFTTMVNGVLGYPFEVDYLMLCWESFADPNTADTLPRVQSQLRIGLDVDGDGFNDTEETYLTTDPFRACSATSTPNDEVDSWPSDADDDRDVDTGDVIKLFSDKVLDPLAYANRSDPNGDGDNDAGDVIKLLGQGQILTKCYQFTFTNNTGGAVDDIHIVWSAALTAVFSARDSGLAGWSSRTISGGGLLLDMDRPDGLGDLAAGGQLFLVVQASKSPAPVATSCRWTLEGVDKGPC